MSSINRVSIIPVDISVTGAELIEVKDTDNVIKSVTVSDIRSHPYVTASHSTTGTAQVVDVAGLDELIYTGAGTATFDALTGAVAGQEILLINHSASALTLAVAGGGTTENDMISEGGVAIVLDADDGAAILKVASIAHPTAGGTGVSVHIIG